VANTITGNVAPGDSDLGFLAQDLGIISSNGHNVFGSDVASSAPGDIEGASAASLFEALDPRTGGGQLAANGGPTQTVALRDTASNPALAGSDPAGTPSVDQRGEPRPQPAGTNPDIGSFELDQTVSGLPIRGTGCADVLLGTQAHETIRGYGGSDVLRGRAGDDVLLGRRGVDVLEGGAGIDQTVGGAGADRFVLRQVDDADPLPPNLEAILDFSRREGDRIDLRRIDANEEEPSDQAFAFIGGAPFAAPGQLRVVTEQDGFLVAGNVDADLATDFALVVHGDLAQLRASDFLL
jgi:Ca2+-binding RTX toxin-like protein